MTSLSYALSSVLGAYVEVLFCFFFFKQKTAYEMSISDWSSDVCSSDLDAEYPSAHRRAAFKAAGVAPDFEHDLVEYVGGVEGIVQFRADKAVEDRKSVV